MSDGHTISSNSPLLGIALALLIAFSPLLYFMLGGTREAPPKKRRGKK